MYIYPENLKEAPTLFLWRLKDLAAIAAGAVVSVFVMAQTGVSLPVIITAAFGFLSIRHDGTSVLDFIKYAVEYFFTQPQEYRWRL